MTIAKLATLVRTRRRAMAVMFSTSLPLGRLDPELRQRIDDASEQFRAADRAIVDELRLRGRPVTIILDRKPVELHLTKHGDCFAEVDPKTGNPIWAGAGGKHDNPRSLLYDYPTSRRTA